MAREANQDKRKKRDGRSCTRRVDGVRALRLRQDPGVALIAAVLFLVGLTTLGLVGIEMASNELEDTARIVSRSQALYQADAGAEEARMRFDQAVGADYLGVGGAGLTMETAGPYTTDWRACVGSSTSPEAVALGCTGATTTPSLQTGVAFSIAAIQHATRSGVIQCYDPEAVPPLYNATAGACLGTDVPAEQITAKASSGNTRRTVVVEFVPGYLTPFSQGFTGREEVEFEDSCTDSYNSNDGAYPDPGNAADCTGGGSQGSVVTDSKEDDGVELEGDTMIHGSVTVGVGGDPTDVDEDKVAGGAGDIKVATETPSYLTPVVPASLLASCSDLEVSESTTMVIGTAGTSTTFCYNELEISDTAKLETRGDVTIYVTGELEVGGDGIVNTTANPTNLTIIVTGDEEVELKGTSDFYGSIYAPESELEIETEDQAGFYGAAISKDLGVEDGSNVHFDLALQSKTLGVVDGYKLFTWRAN